MTENRKPTLLLEVWLEFAAENLQVARHLLNAGFAHYNPVLYHAVTGAEKYLKAYLVNTTDFNPGKTHDLMQVLKFCHNFDPSFRELVPHIAVLNSYTIAGLHPEELALEKPDRNDALEAVDASSQVESFVLNLLKKKSPIIQK